MKNKKLVNRLIERGFDRTYIYNGSVYIVCSNCEAITINGVATHETGCFNACRADVEESEND